MDRQLVLSTAIRSVGYEAGTLEIEIVGGAVYRYLDVPKSLFLEFMRATSKGEFYNERIRDSFASEGPL